MNYVEISYGYRLYTWSRYSSVGIVICYDLDGPGSISGIAKLFFPFSTASTPALGPTQSPIQWVPGALSPGVKRPEVKDGHSPLPSAEVKNGGAVPPRPHMFSWCSA
jgi:hypothetical protein